MHMYLLSKIRFYEFNSVYLFFESTQGFKDSTVYICSVNPHKVLRVQQCTFVLWITHIWHSWIMSIICCCTWHNKSVIRSLIYSTYDLWTTHCFSTVVDICWSLNSVSNICGSLNSYMTFMHHWIQYLKFVDHWIQYLTYIYMDHWIQYLTFVDHWTSYLTFMDYWIQYLTFMDHWIQYLKFMDHQIQHTGLLITNSILDSVKPALGTTYSKQ